MIIVGHVSDIDLKLYDECWYITNNTPNMKTGCKHVPALAPLRCNYNKYRSGAIDIKNLLSSYKMQLDAHEETQKAINDLVEEAKDKWILLVCYCTDATQCHRSVLYSYLRNKGVPVQMLH